MFGIKKKKQTHIPQNVNSFWVADIFSDKYRNWGACNRLVVRGSNKKDCIDKIFNSIKTNHYISLLNFNEINKYSSVYANPKDKTGLVLHKHFNDQYGFCELIITASTSKEDKNKIREENDKEIFYIQNRSIKSLIYDLSIIKACSQSNQFFNYMFSLHRLIY